MNPLITVIRVPIKNTLLFAGELLDDLEKQGIDLSKPIAITRVLPSGYIHFEQEVVIEHGFRLTFHGDASFSIGCKCESATIYNVGHEPTIDKINEAWNQHPHKELTND